MSENNKYYMAIGTDAAGKFVFKAVSEKDLDTWMGGDDNICFLNRENYLELLTAIMYRITESARVTE